MVLFFWQCLLSPLSWFVNPLDRSRAKGQMTRDGEKARWGEPASTGYELEFVFQYLSFCLDLDPILKFRDLSFCVFLTSDSACFDSTAAEDLPRGQGLVLTSKNELVVPVLLGDSLVVVMVVRI